VGGSRKLIWEEYGAEMRLREGIITGAGGRRMMSLDITHDVKSQDDSMRIKGGRPGFGYLP